MEHYSATKRKEALIHATTDPWMDLEKVHPRGQHKGQAIQGSIYITPPEEASH